MKIKIVAVLKLCYMKVTNNADILIDIIMWISALGAMKGIKEYKNWRYQGISDT